MPLRFGPSWRAPVPSSPTTHDSWCMTNGDPGGLANLEQEIHRAFSQMADRVVAGLLAQATADSSFADTAQKK